MESSHWQLFHFHSFLTIWNDILQVGYTWSFTIPSQVRQSTICSTLPKNLFVELEVPSIRPRALDEISNWYKFHFQALQWQTCLLLKQWFLKWWSMAFDLGFLTLKWSTLRIFLVYPCMKSSRKKTPKNHFIKWIKFWKYQNLTF